MRVLIPVVCVSALLWACEKDTPAPTESEPKKPAAVEVASPTFQIVARFDSKAGLEPGAVVKARGFEVGKVTGVELKNEVVVTIDIEVEHHDAVRKDCYARIHEPTIDALSGGSHVELVILNPQSPPIRPGAVIEGATSATQGLAIRGRYKADGILETGGEALESGARAAKQAGQEAVDKLKNSGAVEKGKEALGEGVEAVKDLWK